MTSTIEVEKERIPTILAFAKEPNNKINDEEDVQVIDLTDESIEVHTNVRFSKKKKKKKKKKDKKVKHRDTSTGSIEDRNIMLNDSGVVDDFVITINENYDEIENDIPPEENEDFRVVRNPDFDAKNYDEGNNASLQINKSRPCRQRKVIDYREYELDDVKPYSCDLCQFVFESQDALDIHCCQHHLVDKEAAYRCNECEQNFHNLLGLNMHKRKMHEKRATSYRPVKKDRQMSENTFSNQCLSSGANLKCPEPGCLITLANLTDYKRHAKTHSNSKPYPCPTCKKYFSDWGNLIRHMKTHFKIRPHKCPQCEKRFSCRQSMQSHIRHIHTGEKPFPCSLCDKAFATKSDLNRHHINRHTNERKFECPECGLKFKQRGGLIAHIRRKSAERLWECGVCNKAFTSKGYLMVHMKSHSSYKLYKCDICEKEFSHRISLREHLLTHSSVLNFECSLCSRKFRFRSNKKRHEKICFLLDHKKDFNGNGSEIQRQYTLDSTGSSTLDSDSKKPGNPSVSRLVSSLVDDNVVADDCVRDNCVRDNCVSDGCEWGDCVGDGFVGDGCVAVDFE